MTNENTHGDRASGRPSARVATPQGHPVTALARRRPDSRRSRRWLVPLLLVAYGLVIAVGLIAHLQSRLRQTPPDRDGAAIEDRRRWKGAEAGRSRTPCFAVGLFSMAIR